MANQLITIGRSEENDILYSDSTVSRRHAKISIDNDGVFTLEDLASSNGTYVNGHRISAPTIVNSHDKIELGKQVLSWQDVLSLVTSESDSEIKVHRIEEESKSNRKFWLFLSAFLGCIVLIFVWSEARRNDNPKRPEKSMEASDSLEVIDTTQDVELDKEVTNKKTKNSETSQQDSSNSQNKENARFKRKNNPIVYSISCLRQKSDLNKIIGFGADVQHGWIHFSSDEVGIDEEIEVGKALKLQVDKEYRYSSNTATTNQLNQIQNKLVVALKNPRMTYKLYVIESTDINAFTAGGYIFITTAIIDFALSDDELACVLAHEIYHNELGHINLILRKEKAARNWLGDFADWGLVASQILGASFNQENEVYCDMYGVDLAIDAGYDGHAAEAFWKRMKNQGKGLDKIFSTHPFSNERMNCLHEHLERNYE